MTCSGMVTSRKISTFNLSFNIREVTGYKTSRSLLPPGLIIIRSIAVNLAALRNAGKLVLFTVTRITSMLFVIRRGKQNVCKD
jgi:hypothetical protein